MKKKNLPEKKKRPKAGQPRKYETSELLENAIYEYFYMVCMPIKSKITGKYIYNSPTYQGMCEFLGFSTTKALYNYRNYGDDYKEVIDRAKLKFADIYLKGMLNGELNPKAVMFILTQNNFGFQQKAQIGIENAPNRKFEIEFIKEAKKEEEKKQNCIKIPLNETENGDYIDV